MRRDAASAKAEDSGLGRMDMPLLIFEKEGDLYYDLMAFATLEEAESYHEPFSVEEGILAGFDASGRRLAFEVAPGGVRIRIRALEPPEPAALERRLRGFLVENFPDEPAADSCCGLYCLVEIAVRRCSPIHDPHPVYHLFRDMVVALFKWLLRKARFGGENGG